MKTEIKNFSLGRMWQAEDYAFHTLAIAELEAFSQRNGQQAAINTGTAKATRKATDEAYRDTIKRLNALVEIDDTGKYDTLVRDLNNLIDRQKGVQAARDTRNAKKSKE